MTSRARPPRARSPVPRVEPRWVPWAVLAAGLLLVFAIRLRLLDIPLERDEGEYAYAGSLILDGVPPYTEVHNMKLPGSYYAYAGLMKLFGETIRGIHLGFALWTLASASLVFLLGRRLFHATAGAASAVVFALLTANPRGLGLAGHATHLLVLPVLAGLLLIEDRGRRSIGRAASAGLLLGVAFLMKQHAAVFALFGALLLLRGERGEGRARRMARVGAFAIGVVLPYCLLCLYVYRLGVFGTFWFWTTTYARHYATMVPARDAWGNLSVTIPKITGWTSPLWLLAAVGIVVLRSDSLDKDKKLFLGGLSIASALAVVPGLLFRPHYFLVTYPALGLLAGASTWALGRHRHRLRLAPLLVAATVCLAGFSHPYFTATPAELSRWLYGANPFPESIEIARYVRENTEPTDRIAVLGSEPQIYFYADRRAAAPYVYTYALMEPHPFALSLQREVIAQIESVQPKFLVVVNLSTSWLKRPSSELHFLKWANEYMSRHYERVGIVDLLSDQSTEYVWGDQAARREPRSPLNILVLRRKQG